MVLTFSKQRIGFLINLTSLRIYNSWWMNCCCSGKAIHQSTHCTLGSSQNSKMFNSSKRFSKLFNLLYNWNWDSDFECNVIVIVTLQDLLWKSFFFRLLGLIPVDNLIFLDSSAIYFSLKLRNQQIGNLTVVYQKDNINFPEGQPFLQNLKTNNNSDY